ncbi:Murein DD-endopeptidase MepM and murein hydrolase activator NlpD, contain LysM domain [Streptomyces zhaozhouensis]|uniref:Murein DD-endopeptidase MepM and murein hydrolase activator NlpD, contain LysM domain n=1 Tax=Streptomyces zhaozhouensis TaxID=1300267 RepID=A0A286E6H6_9ACTN|nr:M23 family metallopeptidase [Streptomyces zhaozhouensis]SOD66528.1 Murein DD-endopeptidase MepM and murein hydrolase activator NlpD, contain LysM domain [Streptomyces zhaozhouensis]
MPKITTHRIRENLRLRTRVATVAAAGLTASAVLTGAAVAADGNPADVYAAHTVAEAMGSGHGGPTGGSAGTGAEEAPGKTAEKPKASDWVSPISGDYELSATYGNSGDRWTSKHSGQDFAVPTGTEVSSVHEGTVVKAGGNGAGDGPAYGNAVVIDHGDGTFSQYAHLSEVDVAVGDQVKTGEEIALSGNSGNSSGPHLHFEIRTTADYGTAVDPMEFLRGEHDAEV